ncbi:MAG: helix-turn-helix domain-containing protein [Chloroflexi bacterium]|nr:helix-turn-helix domain-containing protein [Chloroflexota bacterium]
MEHVRLRPGMYVGGTDARALHHLIYEIVDNSVDEALAGRCDHIWVTLYDGNRVSVMDNGSGIPVGVHKEEGVSTLQLVLTEIGAGGKFNNSAYKVSGGLHGVGASAVNALSAELHAEVWRDGYLWSQTYQAGTPVTEVLRVREMNANESTGTRISFVPDFTVLEYNEFSYSTLAQRFREMAFVTRKVAITLRDERGDDFPREITFYFEGGLHSFVRYLNRNRQPLHTPIYIERDVQAAPAEGKDPYSIGVEIAFQYTDTATVTELAFANTINTPDGGMHLTGLRSAITSVINRYARKAGILKEKDQNFSGSDTLEGITAIVSIKHPHPSFESQTKVKLINPEVQGAVSQVVSEALNEFMELNPREARRIVEKCMTSMRAREAARKARDLVRSGPSLLESSTLPGKLADCSQHGENAEIYIVEGDSAGGSAKQARDRHFQAILPLRGKILNTERARLDKILDNNEIKALISALGTGIAEDFDLSRLRYGRVICMSVAGDEPTLVMDNHGQIELVHIGTFIDDCLEGRRDSAQYQVVSFDLRRHNTRFRSLKAVIRHRHEEAMYKVTTRYNRAVKVTSSHSVFVYDDGKLVLKKGNEIRPGDLLVASRRLPRPEASPTHVDLLQTFAQAKLMDALYLRGAAVEKIARQRVLDKVSRLDLWSEAHVRVMPETWSALAAHRQARGLSQKQVAEAIGVKQPITISHYERGVHRPILPTFERYLKAIGWDEQVDYTLALSKMEDLLTPYEDSRNARWREIGAYKPFTHFSENELAQLDAQVEIVPRAHGDKAFGRYLPISRDLLWFLGWFVAEGTLSAHQVSLDLGQKDERFIEELSRAIEAVFGETPRCYHDPDSLGIKLYFHSVLAARLLRAWGLDGKAHEKRLPDIVLSLPETLQYAFLEGYFLGDGTSAGAHLAMTTNSPALKDGLLYLLGQLGLLASHGERQPGRASDPAIQTRHPYYVITIGGKQQLDLCRPIWQRHAHAPHIDAYVRSEKRKALDCVTISDDLVGLEVLTAREIAPVGEYVYDFSVEEDENFICGVGGLCAHNTDADVDGAHIRTLLLTFFYRHMTPLIQEGHLYIAQPPIFLLKSGKNLQYVYAEAGLTEQDLLAKALKRFDHPDKVGVQRYKGLGEMNPEQLWVTTMDPAHRTLLQVTIDDAAEADRVFDMLMGSSVPPRRRFIQTHARTVRNLDI